MFTSAIAAATLAIAASAAAPAAAVNFQGGYDVTANTGDGLQIGVQKLSPINLNFNLNNVGDTFTRDLFRIYTDETTVNDDDLVPQPITVAFNFTQPEGFGGNVDGTTQGNSEWNWVWIFLFNTQNGTVTWNGDAVLPFTGGQLQIHLTDETFNEEASLLGLGGLNEGKKHGSKVAATFTLLAPQTAGVPEPATWAMMISGFGMAGAMLRQRRRLAAA
jgi:hypothetical protein